uniref:Uncharacterized protein n=1 Tax=Lygus hesperus TaxID=30085 RepID=A0A146LRG8_LYGHE
MDWIRHVIVFKELGIIRVMRRHFWWQDNCLFVEDIPKATIRVLHQNTSYFDTPTSIGTSRMKSFLQSTDVYTSFNGVDTTVHDCKQIGWSTHSIESDKEREGDGDTVVYLPFVPIPTEIDVYGVFRQVRGHPSQDCYVEPNHY